MKLGNDFYNTFVNESNICNIPEVKEQRKFWVYSFSIALFSIAGATFPTFIGYNFENVFAICMFAWQMFMYFWLLFLSVKFILIDKKYKIFKKTCYSHLFCFIYLLLSVLFSIIAIFTTKFTAFADQSFKVNFNPMFYFLIYLPLFFSYLIFCYYAFMKCFGKYTKRGSKSTNKF